MIISASRRTDIPAFYAEFFMNRIRAGYCTVPNPFNTKQISKIDLSPTAVDVIVFWTRNPRPLLPHLDELDSRGYRYYFQYTLMANPQVMDPKSPPTESAIKTFQELSKRVGASRVIWRYDPVVFTPFTLPGFHLQAYARIANALCGYTRRSVISIVDEYSKAKKRFSEMAKQGAPVQASGLVDPDELDNLFTGFVSQAQQNRMEIYSCAEEIDLQGYGILPGKCVDDQYIQQVFGKETVHKKDPGQREECGCVVSRDIGMYDICLFGCQYCYATSSFERAKQNHTNHDPQSPSLIGWYEPEKETKSSQQLSLWDEQGKK